MTVEIITPDESLFKGEAKAVTVPGIDGSLGILDHHAPLITALKAGYIKVTGKDGKEVNYAVKTGTAEVVNNKVIILAEKA
jgi:F-type H+-transporting ATPase subunit epsilon